MELITVIVPIYNMSEYLDKCIKSLENQTYRDFKVIMIDDGSTDDSVEKCMAWRRRDNRVMVVSKENMGLGGTRNLGIQIAKTEYVTFLDADDWWHPDYLELMMAGTCSGKHDIVMCDIVFAYKELDGTFTHRLSKIRLPSGEVKSSVNNFFGKSRTFMWGKVYRRSLFTDERTEQPSHAYEDVSVVPYIFSIAKLIYHVPHGLYFYLRNRSGSIVNNFQSLNYLADSLLELYKRFESAEILKENYPSLRQLFWGQLVFVFRTVAGKFSSEIGGEQVKKRTTNVVCTCFPELRDMMNYTFMVPSNDSYLMKAVKNLVLKDSFIIDAYSGEQTDFIVRFNGEVVHDDYKKGDICLDAPRGVNEDTDSISWNLTDDIFYAIWDLQ